MLDVYEELEQEYIEIEFDDDNEEQHQQSYHQATIGEIYESTM